MLYNQLNSFKFIVELNIIVEVKQTNTPEGRVGLLSKRRLTDTYHELDGTFCSTSDASEKQLRQHHLEGIIRAVPSAPRIMVGSILK
jgi:hypothetical protein